MRVSESLGSSVPWGEEPAQVGTEGYEEISRKEIRAFKAQVLRSFELPEDFKLVVKSNSHDFGTYYELGASFEDTEEHWDFFYKLEDSLPEFWDEKAKEELK
jgi:isopenicillin N synthase-like dioxygenase